MTFADGLVRARGHIVFILGLLTAFGVIEWTQRLEGPAPPPATAVQTEAATWAWAAASRSSVAADISRARRLAVGLGVDVDAAPARTAGLSPLAAVAVLDALAARRTAMSPAQAPPR